MDFKNCKRCGRVFNSFGSKICPRCVDEMDKLFLKVRDYIYGHPAAIISEVAEATEVEEDIIMEFLREGRLELKDASMGFPCERCGKPITTGRLCSECLGDFEKEMKKGFNDAPIRQQESAVRSKQMHTIDIIKKKK